MARALGRFLYVEDPLHPADAIFVLAGTYLERPLEAADLYKTGYAPRVILSSEIMDGGELALMRRGIDVLSRAEVARDLLARIGVPPERITVLEPIHNSTSDEARSLRDLATLHHWRSVIVVTSKLHTRRARLAIRSVANGSDLQILIRATRYDQADPEHWWRSRSDLRLTISETQKLLAYALGWGR